MSPSLRTEPVQTILAATSLRAESDLPIRTAAELARTIGSDLHLVHCLPRPHFGSGPFGTGWIDEARARDQMPERHQRLNEQLERCGAHPGNIASITLAVGSIQRILMRAAGEIEPDLIVLGAADGIGSIVDRVIRKSPVPILLARPGLTRPTHVIFATDLSVPSADAIELGLATARQLELDASATVLFTVEPDHCRLDLQSDPWPDISRLARSELATFLERIAGWSSDLEIDLRIERGRACETIRRVGAEAGAGLLVLGTHGSGGFERLLVGSVAIEAARTAPCSVLLVPPQALMANRWRAVSAQRPTPPEGRRKR